MNPINNKLSQLQNFESDKTEHLTACSEKNEKISEIAHRKRKDRDDSNPIPTSLKDRVQVSEQLDVQRALKKGRISDPTTSSREKCDGDFIFPDSSFSEPPGESYDGEPPSIAKTQLSSLPDAEIPIINTKDVLHRSEISDSFQVSKEKNQIKIIDLPEEIFEKIIMDESIQFQANLMRVNKLFKALVERVQKSEIAKGKQFDKMTQDILQKIPPLRRSLKLINIENLIYRENWKFNVLRDFIPLKRCNIDFLSKYDLEICLNKYSDWDHDLIRYALKHKLNCVTRGLRAHNNDNEIFLEAVSQDGFLLSCASPLLKSNKKIVLEAVKQKGFALNHASDIMKADKEVVLAAINQHPWALMFACAAFRADKEIVLAAVVRCGLALCKASETMKADKEVVLAAVKQNGLALNFASDVMKADKEVVLAAVRQCGGALLHASKQLQIDEEF